MFEELERLVKLLNEEVDYVIVEGKRDREALEQIGVKVNVLTVYELDKIRKGSKVVILTDFDEEGKRLNRKLSKVLVDVKIDEWFRKEFGRLLGLSGRRSIESIKALSNNLKIVKGP